MEEYYNVKIVFQIRCYGLVKDGECTDNKI